MPTIGRLKDNDLLLNNGVSERLPNILGGLIAAYPFDGTTETASQWKTGWSGSTTGNGTIQDITNSRFPIIGTQKVRFTGWFKKTSTLNGTVYFYCYHQVNGVWSYQASTFSDLLIADQWVYVEKEIIVSGTVSDVQANSLQGISLRNDSTAGTLEWKECHCYVSNVGTYESNIKLNVDDIELLTNGDLSLPKGLLRTEGTISFDVYPTAYPTTTPTPIYSTRMDGGFDLLIQAGATSSSYWRAYSSSTTNVQQTGIWFPTLNRWYNVTVSWVNNGVAKLYIDGVEKSSMTNCGDWFSYYNSNVNARFSLGSGIRTSNAFKFKNLFVYDKMLSVDEINTLLNSKLSLTPEGYLITRQIVENDLLTIPMKALVNKLEVKGSLKENQNLV